ncbi:fimbrial protein [Proteus sp. LHD240705]|uniref:fimbrial protein n=1 Tax=Proteus sp. LHD240705 TaxID=3400183 RepID=UPI003A4DE2B0
MKRIFVILFLLNLFPSLAVAGADDYVPSPITINTSTHPVVVIGSADAHTYPRVIGELSGTSNQYIFNGGSLIALMRGKFTPTLPKIGKITYSFRQGKNTQSSDFDIFDIGVPGLGIIIGMAGYWPATPLVPINSSSIYIDPVAANTNPNAYNGATGSFGARLYVAFVATGRLPNGYVTIPTKQLGHILLESNRASLNNKRLTAPVMLNGGRIQVQSQTCSMNQKNYVVPLNTVYQSQFTSLYKEVQGGEVNIQLQCQDGIDVYATLNDATQHGNRSDILTLATDSTAKGVGLRLYKNNEVTAISYGSDTPNKGNQNQWHFSNYRGEINPRIKLKANYIKTENTITPGSVKAVATITFSYQ